MHEQAIIAVTWPLLLSLFLIVLGYTLSRCICKRGESPFYYLIVGLTLVFSIIVYPALLLGTIYQGVTEIFAIVLFIFILSFLYLILKKREKFSLSFTNMAFISLFSLSLLIRPVLSLAGGGILAWDSLSYYLPWAKYFLKLNRIPLYDLQRCGLVINKPLLVSLLYSFSYYLTQSSPLAPLAICLCFIVGLGAISAEIVYKLEKSTRLSLISMVMTITMPVYDTFYLRWGTYLDMPFAFFYLTSVYFLIRILNEDDQKAHFLFWNSLSLAFLTKEMMWPMLFTYFIVLAYYCKERLMLILLANSVLAGRIVMGLLDLISFDWVPIYWVIYEFFLLLSLQLFISIDSSNKKTIATSFTSCLKKIISVFSLLLFFPIIRYAWLSFLSGNPVNVMWHQYFVFFALLALSFPAILYIFKKGKISHLSEKGIKFQRLLGFFIIGLIFIGVYGMLAFPIIITPENLTFTILSSLIYFFFSNWFGSIYVIPKIYGFYHICKESNETYKMLLCVILLILSIWHNLGLVSVRYVAVLTPLVSTVIITGLIRIFPAKGIEQSTFSFFTLMYIIMFLISLNYIESFFSFPEISVQHDVLRNKLIIVKNIFFSLLFSIIYFVVNWRSKNNIGIIKYLVNKVSNHA